MARRVVWLLAALGLASGSAWAQSADELVAKGRALAAANCARCHAIGEGGESPHEKAPPFRDVVTRYPSEHLAEALAEGIVSGHPDMPVYVMTAAEIDQFLAFLDTLSPPVPASPGAAPSPR